MKNNRRIYLGLCALVAAMVGLGWAQEHTGKTRQSLVGGSTVDAATQEDFGLLTYEDGSGSCSASLLRNNWVITAAHCVSAKNRAGQFMPDPNKPGQNILVPIGKMQLSAAWTAPPQTQNVVRAETFWPYDVALLQLAGPFKVHGSTTNYTRLIFQDGQFPYYGNPVGADLLVFGRGIKAFATGQGASALPSDRDGLFRLGYFRPAYSKDNAYWYPTKSGQAIAGGDSGGPSFAKVLNEYALVGVHSNALPIYMPGKPQGGWNWVTGVTEAADAPIAPVWNQINIIMGPDPNAQNPPPDKWQSTPIAPPDPGLYATFLYGLRPDGTLVWWRHDGAALGTDKWQGPRRVGTGWDFTKIIPGGGDVIYGITNDGKLMWFRHTDFNTGNGLSVIAHPHIEIPAPGNNNALGGSPQSNGNEILGGDSSGKPRRPRFIPNEFRPNQSGARFTEIQEADPNPPHHTGNYYPPTVSPGWKGPLQIGTGWKQYKQVFSGGDGIIYAVTRDNTLLWFKHDNYLSDGVGALEGPKVIQRNWNMSRSFSCGNGVIYGIVGLGASSQLDRFKHVGVSDGSENWMSFGGLPYQQVQTGWNKYKQVFSAGVISTGAPQELRGPVIYGITNDGHMSWQVQIRLDANGLGRNWLGPKQQPQDWSEYKQVIALIPANLPVGGGVH